MPIAESRRWCLSWCTYDTRNRQPNWVIQSPGGRQGTREGTVVLAVFLLTVAIVPLARDFPVIMLWADAGAWMPLNPDGLSAAQVDAEARSQRRLAAE